MSDGATVWDAEAGWCLSGGDNPLCVTVTLCICQRFGCLSNRRFNIGLYQPDNQTNSFSFMQVHLASDLSSCYPASFVVLSPNQVAMSDVAGLLPSVSAAVFTLCSPVNNQVHPYLFHKN